jgi:hypothetical protein
MNIKIYVYWAQYAFKYLTSSVLFNTKQVELFQILTLKSRQIYGMH